MLDTQVTLPPLLCVNICLRFLRIAFSGSCSFQQNRLHHTRSNGVAVAKPLKTAIQRAARCSHVHNMSRWFDREKRTRCHIANAVENSTEITCVEPPCVCFVALDSAPNQNRNRFTRLLLRTPHCLSLATEADPLWQPSTSSIDHAAPLDVRDADIHKAVTLIRVGDAERYRWLVWGRATPDVDKQPSIRDLNVRARLRCRLCSECCRRRPSHRSEPTRRCRRR